MSKRPPALHGRASDKRPDPLFVLGDARSGTTYLSNLLTQHKDIGMAPESNCVVNLLRAYGSQIISKPTTLDKAFDLANRDDKFRDWQIRREEILPLLKTRLPVTIAEFLRIILIFYCEREFPGCMVWGIKKGYIPFMWELIEHFPQAKFIHIVRDGRAVFSSKKKALHTKTGKPFEKNPVQAAGRWIRLLQTFKNFSEKHPAYCLEISYEGLVREPTEVLSSIFHFLELKDVKIDSNEQGPSWIPDRYRYLHPNVHKPPQLERIDAWQQELTLTEIRRYEALAQYELENQGYALLFKRQRYSVPVLIYRLKQFVKSLYRSKPLSS